MKTINGAIAALRSLGMVAVALGLGACATTPAALNANTTASVPALTSKSVKVSAASPAPGDSSALLPATDTQAQATDQSSADASATAPSNDARDPGDTSTYTNLWDRIRAGFRLPRMEGPYVVRQEQWFVNNPDYMERMLQRANLYLYHIVEQVDKRHMPMEIALLPAIESAYQPQAFSHARASGLWQFMPSTGRLYGLKTNWWYDGRRDVMASTEAALDYLQKLHDDFNGDWDLALAAYNCGEGKVERAIEHNRRLGLPTDYQDLDLPPETRQYVPKLMAIVNIVSDPDRYGLTLTDIPNSPYFVQVDVGSQIDLSVVAKLSKLPLSDIYAMNPGFNRFATAPNGPHRLLLPVSAKDEFLDGLNDLPPDKRVQWARHEVRRGDTLSVIAHHFGVPIESIRSANNLRSNFLRVGQNLLIPVSGRRLIIKERRPRTRVASTHVAGKVRIIHRVRRGETLYSIAHRYNVYVAQLAHWNLMQVRDVLRLGQRLRIWITPNTSSAAARSNQSDAS